MKGLVVNGVGSGASTEMWQMLSDRLTLQIEGAGRYVVEASVDGAEWSMLMELSASCVDHSRTVVVDLLSGAWLRVVCLTGTMESVKYSDDLAASNEEQRMANEDERRDNESARVENENGRIEAESVRVSAEQGRVEAEDARVEAESVRVSAEQRRAEAEDARVDAEDARVEAESVRVANEAGRIEAEGARVIAEEARALAEASRDDRYEGAELVRDARYAEAEQARDVQYAEAEVGRDDRYEAAEGQRNEAFAVAEVERDAHLRDVIGAFIPTGIKVDCPERITMGNLKPRGVEVEMLPEGAMKNVMYLSDNRSVMVWPDGRLEVTGKGKSVVHVVPTMNTALARSFVVDVVDPGMRMTQRKGVRLLSGGGLRLT